LKGKVIHVYIMKAYREWRYNSTHTIKLGNRAM